MRRPAQCARANTGARGDGESVPADTCLTSSSANTMPSTRLIDDERAVSHLMNFLATEGPSRQEQGVAQIVREKLVAAGCKPAWIRHDSAHRRLGDGHQVGNLIVHWPAKGAGRRSQPRRLFCGHMDTVPLCRGAVPVRRGRRIVAKGQTALGGDNRTAVAAIVTAAEAILKSARPHPPLTLLFTVGEEIGLRGAREVRLADLRRPQLGFNVDSGDPARVIIGATAAERWEVDVFGIAAHAGVHPDNGVSAALIASHAIAAVAEDGYFGKIQKGRQTGTSNVGIVRGGEATNQVTDHVYILGESRSHNANFVRRITQRYERAFRSAATRTKNSARQSGKASFRWWLDYPSFRLPASEGVIRVAEASVRRLGLTPQRVIVDGGVDANYLNSKGIPTVTLGAGQHGAHTLGEYVDVKEYLSGCKLLTDLMSG